jgi:hypothetical protein
LLLFSEAGTLWKNPYFSEAAGVKPQNTLATAVHLLMLAIRSISAGKYTIGVFRISLVEPA